MDKARGIARRIPAEASQDGLALNDEMFNSKVAVNHYEAVLGPPSRIIEAGQQPAPAGHRNNQVHVFDEAGIYLTEHHATGLIESVNFVFDPSESPFPIEHGFSGDLTVFGFPIQADTTENDVLVGPFRKDLPGEYSVAGEQCWVSVSLIGRRTSSGKRSKPRYVVRVSACF
jgi:hypothetical protein